MENAELQAALSEVIEIAKLLKLAIASDDLAEIALALKEARSKLSHANYKLYSVEKFAIEEALKSKLGGLPEIDFSDS